MLQPLQLEELSARYPEDIAELRHFLDQAGIPLDAPDTLSNLAARLQHQRTFRRDLISHVLILNHATDRPVGYPALLGLLALAAAGPHFAAAAEDADAHALLRFLMEARGSFNLPSPSPQMAAPELLTRHIAPEDTAPTTRRRILWATAAACLLVAFLLGLALHRSPGNSHNAAPITTANTTTAPAPAAPASAPATPTPAPAAPTPAAHAKPAAGTLADLTPVPSPTHPTPTHAAPVRRNPAHSIQAQHSAIATSLNPAPIVRRRAPSAARAYTDDLSALVPRVQPVTIPSTTDTARSTPLHTPLVRPTSLGVMAANVTYSPAPAYPPAASAAHVQGEVKLEAEVDPEGNVASARVISGPPLLREAAVNAVEHWHYRPYLAEGKPIYTNTQIVMDFQLP